jgi:hypothetical protein
MLPLSRLLKPALVDTETARQVPRRLLVTDPTSYRLVR